MEGSSSFSVFHLLVFTLVTIIISQAISVVYKECIYWKKRRIPHPRVFPIIGSRWRVIFRRTAFADYVRYLYNYYSTAKYVGLMDFTTPAFYIRDCELIKEVAVKHFDRCPDHISFIDEEIDPIFGRNVFSLRGDRWREMRNTLSPFFTTSKMRFMFDLVSKTSRDFVGYLHAHPEVSSSIELKEVFTRYTNDVIATSAFGISVNSMDNRDNDFYKAGNTINDFSGIFRIAVIILFRWKPRLMRLAGFSWIPITARNFFVNVISEAVKARDEQGVVRPDMIQLLIEARNKEKLSNPRITDEDILAQAFIFFLAGFDTSSTALSYLTFELAVNADIQEKLRTEVDKYFAQENGEISYDSLAKMEYLDMVVSEALRKYPPTIIAERVCVKKFELPPSEPGCNSVTVNPGDAIWFSLLGIHYDPKYFPNPEKFDPERFNAENKHKIDPYTYFPFGLGPRKCIGNRFALMEIKIVIVHILQKFIIKSTEKTKPVIFKKGSFQMIPESGLWIGLEKRVV